jgi:hypothetical protein
MDQHVRSSMADDLQYHSKELVHSRISWSLLYLILCCSSVETDEMSDEQLAIFLKLILNQLNNGIDRIENSLPDTFRVETGGSNVFFDPKVIDYPILSDIYQLRYDLHIGIESLLKEKK